MLENIRENSQGMIAKVILGFVILTFAFAGIGSYTNSVDTSVAEVNGEKISQAEFDKAYQQQRNRMAQQFGEMFDTLSADANYMANFRNSVLDNLINEKLIDQASNDLAIRISDERLKKVIREMPEFQVDGKFDNNRYLALINQAGFYQSSDFRDYLRVDMTRRQLSQAIVASEFSLPYQEEQLTALQNQKRDIRFASISAEQFKANVEVTEAEISTYYQENQNRFQNQEKVKVNYVALDVNDLAGTIEATDEELEEYYQQNGNRYRQDEQRRFSHILIEIADDEAAAQAKISDLLAKVKAGEDFAELAKAHSADSFSGENGGDLEWVEPGVMDEAFDEAAFALSAVGDVSEVVKTDFGFHIIKLTEIQAEQVKAFAEVKEEILATVKKQKAEDKFFELQQEMARLSFEFPDSLEDTAGAVGKSVQTTDWLSRFGNLAPFDNNKVIDAAFSDIVIKEQMNSDVIEVSDTLAIVLRVNEYQPANVKPLSEVTEQIKSALVAEKATQQAQAIAAELLAAFKAGDDINEKLTGVGAAFEVKVDVPRYGADIDNALAREAFKLPHPSEGKVSAATVTLSNGDLALVEVQAVKAGTSEVNLNLAQQQTQQLAQVAYRVFVNSLREQAKISRRESVESSSQL